MTMTVVEYFQLLHCIDTHTGQNQQRYCDTFLDSTETLSEIINLSAKAT